MHYQKLNKSEEYAPEKDAAIQTAFMKVINQVQHVVSVNRTTKLSLKNVDRGG